MCGIAGYFLRAEDEGYLLPLNKAIQKLNKRGPDFQTVKKLSAAAAFAHARLSIIDTSYGANQPMSDAAGQYTIIFNGEIFNYRELREQFLQGVELKTSSDTEVLLHLFAVLGKKCLNYLNGFFSFAIYNHRTSEIFLARDRFGIKPLLIYADEKMIVFASELKAILQFPVKKKIDFNSLALYLQLNYIPGNNSILKNVQKLPPGYFAEISEEGELKTEKYYDIPYCPGEQIKAGHISYNDAAAKLKLLVQESVARRLVADVPLGTFLSGGIDSSIITACAAKHIRSLNTFSIGYKDEPYFDETYYANLVAKKFNTQHTVFSISTDEMFENVFSILDYIDEPFADSSAIAVYVLSQKTRQKVTVALSGDGGDELFAGYNKHAAELNARKHNLLNYLITLGGPLIRQMPASRHSRFSNFIRQLNRYNQGLQLSPANRYWHWCTLNTQKQTLVLLKQNTLVSVAEVEEQKAVITSLVANSGDLNDVLMADMKMVLPNDMLTKVDLMSMANSLEVRVPFLDYTVVNYAFSLPVEFKIARNIKKRILKDAFIEDLPAELLNRPKKGFEVPLLKWIRTGLHSLIDAELLSEKFIEEQGIFDYTQISSLKQKVFSNNPGDVHATIWALAVFQYWYKKYYL
jgi:asparagine synthase (glutamine-hydrolysing)